MIIVPDSRESKDFHIYGHYYYDVWDSKAFGHFRREVRAQRATDGIVQSRCDENRSTTCGIWQLPSPPKTSAWHAQRFTGKRLAHRGNSLAAVTTLLDVQCPPSKPISAGCSTPTTRPFPHLRSRPSPRPTPSSPHKHALSYFGPPLVSPPFLTQSNQLPLYSPTFSYPACCANCAALLLRTPALQ